MVTFRPQLVDFDGDGRLDILAGSNCCDSNAFHIMRRNADGSWAERKRVEMIPPGDRTLWGVRQRSCVTAADYDGDGVPDLLSVGPNGSGIVVARGPIDPNKPVAFPEAIDVAPVRPVLGEGEYIQSLAIADWDRDGKPDLLILGGHTNGTRGLFWHRNLGGPGLTKLGERKPLIEFTPGMNVRYFCAGDWNGDGWLDLVLTRADEAIKDKDGRHLGWRRIVWLHLRE